MKIPSRRAPVRSLLTPRFFKHKDATPGTTRLIQIADGESHEIYHVAVPLDATCTANRLCPNLATSGIGDIRVRADGRGHICAGVIYFCDEHLYEGGEAEADTLADLKRRFKL